MFLTPDQLESLTDRRTRPAQRRMLDALGVKYGMRADGSLVVLQSAVEAAIGAPAPKGRKREFVIHATP